MANEKEITAADAAKAVVRLVPEIKDGKPTGETLEKAVAAKEVLDFKVRGDQVTVVTIDGQKFTGTLKAAAK